MTTIAPPPARLVRTAPRPPRRRVRARYGGSRDCAVRVWGTDTGADVTAAVAGS